MLLHRPGLVKKEKRRYFSCFLWREEDPEKIIIIPRSFTKSIPGLLYTSRLSKYSSSQLPKCPSFHLPKCSPFRLSNSTSHLQNPPPVYRTPSNHYQSVSPNYANVHSNYRAPPKCIKPKLQFTKIPSQTTKLHCQITRQIPIQNIKLPIPMSKIIIRCLLLKATTIPLVLDLRKIPPELLLRLSKAE